MKNPLIGIVLKLLTDSYNAGACDKMNEEELEELFQSLSSFKDKMEDKLDKVLTIEEVSLYLNCTRQTVNNYIKEGKLKPLKHLGGVLEFKLKDVKQFIKKNRK